MCVTLERGIDRHRCYQEATGTIRATLTAEGDAEGKEGRRDINKDV